ncbi:hypothetical protein RF11_04932 [Thelohanellus kitauei]|uniref:Uncharacterized protein n=1 Tax=Thelohanellus kitauei TaxID=669202 RepID=A0A0C2JMI2_THEKT|nr:hypothetical protein RF11_04932 [Thelohanellus kitauei]
MICDEVMTNDLNKILKSLVNSQQQQTEGLIRAQREHMSTVIEKFAHMMIKVTVVPSFEAFQASKEPFSLYQGRLEQHFASCRITHSCYKKAQLLSWMGSETFYYVEDSSEVRYRTFL